MKKLIMSILFMAFAFTMNANTDGKPITFEQLPENAKTIIVQNFDKEAILVIIKEFSEYEVKLHDGTELEFDRKGNLKKVDCKHQQVPEALIPTEVLSYVKANYASAFITEWGKDDGQWKAELSNSLELIFNRKYQFVGIDD